MPLVIATDFTRVGVYPIGRLGGPLVCCWIECESCRRQVSRVEIGGGDWETALVSADAARSGCRWTTGQRPDPRTSRPYCPVCQRAITPGPFGWSDGRRHGLPPAPLPEPAQLSLPELR